MSTSKKVAVAHGHTGSMADHPVVPERALPRRQYTARYKLAVLAEYEHLNREGKGALLRREGLYTSLISEWRSTATGVRSKR